MMHMHYPETGDFVQPHGTRGVCHYCGQTIMFIEGYQSRRDYWKVVPAVRRREPAKAGKL